MKKPAIIPIATLFLATMLLTTSSDASTKTVKNRFVGLTSKAAELPLDKIKMPTQCWFRTMLLE